MFISIVSLYYDWLRVFRDNVQIIASTLDWTYPYFNQTYAYGLNNGMDNVTRIHSPYYEQYMLNDVSVTDANHYNEKLELTFNVTFIIPKKIKK